MPPSRPFRVIVVEDDEDIRGLIVGQLAQEHYEVLAAGSLSELHGIMAARPADLIVLDLNLPDGDGLSLCRELRAQGSGVQIILEIGRASCRARVCQYVSISVVAVSLKKKKTKKK